MPPVRRERRVRPVVGVARSASRVGLRSYPTAWRISSSDLSGCSTSCQPAAVARWRRRVRSRFHSRANLPPVFRWRMPSVVMPGNMQERHHRWSHHMSSAGRSAHRRAHLDAHNPWSGRLSCSASPSTEPFSRQVVRVETGSVAQASSTYWSNVSDSDRLRCDSMSSRSCSILRSASAITSAPAMNRRGGGSSFARSIIADASFAGSPAW